MSPTAAGERLFRNIGPPFDETEAEITRLHQRRQKPAGTIRIIATDHAGNRVLLPKLQKPLREVSRDQGRQRNRVRPDRRRRSTRWC